MAGVSIGTVSKALNAGGRLRQETRDNVVRVAREIGYRPNDLAQSLHRAKSRTIGIISNDSFGRFTFPIVEALEERLAEEGIAVFMCNATDDPARERQHLDQLLGKRVDGLVVTARRADKRVPIGPHAHGLPVIYVFSQADDPQSLSLLPDDEGGAVLAVEHLAAIGRKRVAHITGPEHFEAVRLRKAGYLAGLKAAGLSATDGFYLPGVWSEAWGREAIGRLFDGAQEDAGCAVLRQRPDRPRRSRRAAGARPIGAGRCGDRRLRQLGGHGAGGPAALDQRGHEFARARPRGRRTSARHDRRQARAGRVAAALFFGGPAIDCCRSVRKIRMSAFKPVRFVDVHLEGDFWRERLETVLTRTIPSQHVQLGEHGILEALTLPNPPPPLRFPRNHHNFTVQVFWDSDVGKWIEAASYALSHRRDADIESKIEDITDKLERAQAPDGYVNCWYLQREPDKRWTNLRDNHELYNLGHLLEGGIAYFLATGRRRLLGNPRALCRACAHDLRAGPEPEARLLRAPGDRAGADPALSPDGRAQAPRSRQLFHQRARPATALFRRGGAPAR